MWRWSKSSKKSGDIPKEHLVPLQPGPPEAPKAKVILITGTSGSGRKRAAKQLSADLGIPYVIPYTTRPIRPNENDGEHYRFIADSQFRSMADAQTFFQSVQLERGQYGISREELSSALEQSQTAIVVVNREGVQAFRKEFGEQALRIFLYVTKEDIRLRLEREEAPVGLLEEYLKNYMEDVLYKKESDYLLQNMEPSVTVEKIKAFLQDKI